VNRNALQLTTSRLAAKLSTTGFEPVNAVALTYLLKHHITAHAQCPKVHYFLFTSAEERKDVEERLVV